MNARTSSLQKYIDAFGEDVIKMAIKNAGQKTNINKLIGITNPAMRFILKTTYEANGHLYTKQSQNGFAEDYGYFKLTASVLDKFKKEIIANTDYKSELERDLLGQHSGPMLSALNEIIVGGYYKSLGMKVSFNSSRQQGLADIDLTDMQFASDTKTFPNSRLRIEAIVNESAKELITTAGQISNQGLLISVFNPDNRLVHESFRNMAEAFQADKQLGKYEDTTLHAMIWDNNYKAADFHFSFQPNNVNIYFQASWDMGPAIDKLKESLLKADDQAKALNKESIPWVMVPRDANRQGIETVVLRFEGKLHGFVMDNKNIFAVPVYGLEFEGDTVKTVFDIFETGRNTFKINAETFNAYIHDLYSRVEMYV